MPEQSVAKDAKRDRRFSRRPRFRDDIERNTFTLDDFKEIMKIVGADLMSGEENKRTCLLYTSLGAPLLRNIAPH